MNGEYGAKVLLLAAATRRFGLPGLSLPDFAGAGDSRHAADGSAPAVGIAGYNNAAHRRSAGQRKNRCAALGEKAKPLPQNHFAICRHAVSAGDAGQWGRLRGRLDLFLCGDLTKVAIPEPRRFRRRGFYPASRLRITYTEL